MEAITHHRISDLYKTLALPVEGEMDFTILSIPDIHPHLPFQSPNLRADYFSFILTKDGSGVYYLDEHRFPFRSGSFYFTNPGHLKSYELTHSNEAYLITLTETFLRENVHPEIYNEFPFLLAEIVPPHELSSRDFEEFETLYQQLFNEFQGASLYSTQILGKLFGVLLLKLKEQSWLSYNPIEEGNRNSQIVRSFKQLLESAFKQILESEQQEEKLQAQHLAESLNLHPNYLNAVIKSKTGRTVQEWISAHTLSLAKSLLVNTSYSSKQIAYKLGFREPTHFSRFFKQHTQLSPGQFRKQPPSQGDL